MSLNGEVRDYLELILPSERDTNGSASFIDFMDLVLPDLIEVFATDSSQAFDLIPGRSDYKVVTLVNVVGFAVVAAVGIVNADNSDVAICEITIDKDPPETFNL